MRRDVGARLERAQVRQKIAYDRKHAVPRNYEDGQRVWFKNLHRRRGISPKLSPRFRGPGVIKCQVGPTTYEVDFRGRSYMFHVDKLKPYVRGVGDDTGSSVAD